MTPAQKAWVTRRARAADTARRVAQMAADDPHPYAGQDIETLEAQVKAEDRRKRPSLIEMAAAFPEPSPGKRKRRS